MRIAGLEDFKDKEGVTVEIDIVLEDELLRFQVSSPFHATYLHCSAHRFTFQGPHNSNPGQQAPIFSFQVAIIRPTAWIYAIFPHADEDNAAVFELDVMSDTNDMNLMQQQNLDAYISEIQKVSVATLPNDGITRHLYVRYWGVLLVSINKCFIQSSERFTIMGPETEPVEHARRRQGLL